MESREQRIEKALEQLHEVAQERIEAFPGDVSYRGPLEVASRLTPDAVDSQMARYAHAEMSDGLADAVATCGEVDLGLAAVVNGMKDLIENIHGGWIYEDARWTQWQEPRAEVVARGLEVAK